MAAISSKTTEIHYSLTENGTYAPIGKVLSASAREEGQDDERIYVFADDAPIVEVGQDEKTLEIPMLYDFDDAGQTALRTARRTAATIYIRELWDGTQGYQYPAQVLSLNIESDPNGTGVNRFVRGTMTLRTAGGVTEIAA